jgi:two-component system, NtrC family, nitrogen regulation sensor histidine kinase NtrY
VTFRTRILLACLFVALAPLVTFALGARRAVRDPLTAQFDERVASGSDAVRQELNGRAATFDTQLRALAARLDRDPVYRAALLQHGDRGTLLEYGSQVMPVSGLDYLLLLDEDGTVLSSGHFRNDYGRQVPAFAAPREADGPLLVAARRPSGPFLVLARAHAFTVGERRFWLVGGVEVDGGFVSALARAPLVVALDYPGGSLASGSGELDIRDTRGVEQIAVPFIDDVADAAQATEAHWTIAHSLAPLRALLRGMDAWFLGALAAAILLAIVMARAVAARVNRPLEQLAHAATRVHLDRLDEGFPTRRHDEIGMLARTLDTMVQRLRDSAARLRAAERRATVGDIARQVNHDIRNGLLPIRNVIQHLAEVAQAAPSELGAVFTERASTLHGSIGYLESLATRYARLSPPAERHICDVNDIIRATLANHAQDDRVRLQLSSAQPRVTADPVALRRVIENLAVNALDSLDPDGGSVTVTTSVEADALVSITVSDTGAGIEPEALDRIFDDFYTTKPHGTGLGLSIVRRLVSDMGGRIRVESRPGAGTTFRIELAAAA